MRPPRSLWAPALAGLLLVGLVVLTVRPGAHDLPSGARTGMASPDDGYWSAPLRRLAGAGGQDTYDDRLALSLALPQNALGAAAHALGVPYEAARFAAVLLGAAIVGASILRLRQGGAFLLPFLATAPVFAHLGSDLGEGPAFAISTAFAVAALRRRWVLAGLLAGLGLSQKACGLFLGVGLLVGVLAEGAGRVPRLARAALGVAIGVLASVAVAVCVFGDEALPFLLRPWQATQETGAGIPSLSRLVSMAYPAHHGVGASFALPFLVVALLARRLGPRPPAIVAAAAAGLLFAGAFPDPWRILPVLPLFAFALHREPSSKGETQAAPGPWAFLLLALAAPQAVGALLAWIGWRPGAIVLTALSLGTIAALATPAAQRARWIPLLAAGAWMAALVVGATDIARTLAARTTQRLEFSAEISRRLPPDAHLVGYSFLAARFRGTLWYPPFESLWTPELESSGPTTLYRLRTLHDNDPAVVPVPSGYDLLSSDTLGKHLYSGDDVLRPLVLDTLHRRP